MTTTLSAVREIDALRAEVERLQAIIDHVEAANNEAGAHRFDFDTTTPGPGGRVGGPDNFYNGCRYVVVRVRTALRGEQ